MQSFKQKDTMRAQFGAVLYRLHDRLHFSKANILHPYLGGKKNLTRENVRIEQAEQDRGVHRRAAASVLSFSRGFHDNDRSFKP